MEKVYTGKVIRLGTSEAIVIPKPILKALDIHRGDSIVFGVYRENEIIIRRLTVEELKSLKPQDIEI